MEHVAELGGLVRAVSGLFWLGLGIAIVRRHRDVPEARWLGVACIAFVGDFLVRNLFSLLGAMETDFGPVAREIVTIAADLIAAGALILALRAVVRSDRGTRRIVGVLLITLAAALVALVVITLAAYARFEPAPLFALFLPVNVAQVGAFALLAILGLAFVAKGARNGDRGLLWVGAGLVLFPAVRAVIQWLAIWEVDAELAGMVLFTGPSLVIVAAMALPLMIGAILLARAAMLPVALALLGIVLASMLLDVGYGDVIGYSGIARLVGFAMIAYGLLRFAPFGGGSPPVRDARVVFAPAAIALVFIVAEVAQSFVSAQYGLLIGGVVAGALLFAAEPLQRALGRGGGGSRAASIYRASLRAALADGAMTEAEEIHLAEVQEHLGLAAREATRLRHEIERELGLRA